MSNGTARAVEARFRTTTARLATAALAAALAALPAAALDLPHASPTLAGCADCHTGHNASNPNITKDTCSGCHTTRYTWSPPWTAADQANLVAGTGSSHSWSASVTNAAAGAAMPADATLRRYVGAGGVLTCSTCHVPHAQDNTPADPMAPTAVTASGRHFQRIANNLNQMCLNCHAARAQSTTDSRTYTGTARSHPVRYKTGTTDLTLAAAGAGGGADWTYHQTPYDSAIKATVASYTGGNTVTLDATLYRLGTNALQGWVVRFASGPFKNVLAPITSNTANVLTLGVTLPTIAAASTGVEIDRVGNPAAYDVTTTMAATANTITNTSMNWMTAGTASPTTGAGSVTILSTTAAAKADVGKTCSITGNTATALTLAGGCLTVTPAAGTTWAYRINWRLDGTGTTSAAGTTTTFVDSARTLFATDSIAGLQIRFKPSNFVARITAWNATTFTGTFSPARGTATAAAEDYVLEPAQVGVFRGAASAAGTTTTLTDSTQTWTANALVGLLVRFTRPTSASRNYVARITANTATGLTFSAIPSAVASGDTFEIDLDGNVSNNVALGGTTATPAPGFQTGTVVCSSCHGVHYADSNAATYDWQAGGGDGQLLRRAPGDETCNGCHDTKMHSSMGVASSKYDTWGTGFTCYTCHQPHGTNNIYLVRQSIVTPNSGTRTVDFRDTAGTGAFSFAAASSVAPTTQICTVCHTRTSRSTNGAAYDWSNHFAGASCTGCHTHEGGFAGAESKGATACHLCHDYGMRVADAGRTAAYHHVMEQSVVLSGTPAVAVYPTFAQPTTTTTDNDKTCMQCHVDHNAFRPDMNTSLGANARGNNLRTRIGNAPPSAANNVGVIAAPNDTSSYFGNYDYANSGVGGICISCHTSTQTKDWTNQKNPSDGTIATVAIPLADYSASPHAYNVPGAITSGGPFTVSCTKCHNSEVGSYQSGAKRFSLHNSVDRRLRAPLGQGAAQQDDHSEDFCYRCHSTFANAAAIGGVAKAAANQDWYGAITNMSAASQDVYTEMQKGTAGSSGGSTTTTNTLYFQPTTAPTAPAPTGNLADTPTAGGTSAARTMTPAVPTAANETLLTTTTTLTTGTTQNHNRVVFASPPVATAFTTAAGNYVFNVFANQSVTTAQARVRYAVYVWTAANAKGADLVTRANYATAPGTANPGTALSITGTGLSGVAVGVGDKIVVDLEFQTINPTVTSATLRYVYGSTAQAYVTLPANTTFTFTSAASASIGRHDVAAYTGRHKPNPAEENAAWIAANKHVECEDCHDPHATKAGLHTKGGANGSIAGGVLFGASMVTPTYASPATNWQAATTITYAAGAVGATSLEAYVCFRCHSNYNTAIPNSPFNAAAAPWNVGGDGFTNVALEFATSNQSYHPVLGALPATDPGTAGSSRLEANQLCNATSCTNTGAQTWTPGSRMTCTDCHNADTASPAAQGPHGSAVRFMLAGVNKAWPFTVAGATTGTLFRVNTSETGIGTNNGLFCRNCHPAMNSSTYSNSMHSFANTTSHGSGANFFTACTACHIRVPHGGKVSRLLATATTNLPARYKVTGQNNTAGAWTKGTRTSYSQSAGWSRPSGCSTHGGTGTESW